MSFFNLEFKQLHQEKQLSMLNLAHIINAVAVKESSDLYIAQPITFQSIKIAREFASQHSVDVAVYSAQFEEDSSIVPGWIIKTPNLEKSVLDIGEFKTKRKLPLIQDILNSLYDESNADYFIYTNVDIALMPHFYVSVRKIIELGYDAFVINRRTIPKFYKNVEDIPLMYSVIGKSHPGYDCFIFKRNIYPRYYLGTACIGMRNIGKVLMANLVAYATKFRIFENEHLTFHIGNDGPWKDTKYSDYTFHNKSELLKVLINLEKNLGLVDEAIQLSRTEKLREKALAPSSDRIPNWERALTSYLEVLKIDGALQFAHGGKQQLNFMQKLAWKLIGGLKKIASIR